MSRVPGTPLHVAIALAAARDPDRVAVREGHRDLDYRGLLARAGALAATLHGLGTRPGDRVAIHLDKTTEAVVAILGTLMAGACYVPLDARGPTRRAAVILADCGARVVVGTRSKSSRVFAHLPHGAAIETLVHVDGGEETVPGVCSLPWAEATAVAGSPPAVEVDPEWPAYILSTSGSTGTPKGVVLSHRAALGFVEWAASTFPMTPHDRVIAQSPFHFDLSVFDLFVTLGAGATLFLPPPGIAISPSGYVRFLEEEGITVLYATPALLSSLERDGRLGGRDLSRLRTVLFAGDVMPPRALAGCMRAIPGARFANLYGPTETNVCTWHEVTSPPEDDRPLPIGRACRGLEVRIVDHRGTALPGSGSGELWVSGPSLLSGYWNRPLDTADRLVADATVPSRLWYRTGDRVRRDDEGVLHFCGRIDSMVKIRGYRVEPGEVEDVLRRHASVREAVVVPVTDSVGTISLAALVSTYDRPVAARDLQRLCAEHLPEAMIPSAIVVTERLPQTSTGKIDRQRIQSELSHGTKP